MKITMRTDELDVLRGFLEESWEHLEGIEDRVLELEENQDLDTVNSIFRPVHTIKGTAAFLGLNDIKELCHETETVLDQVRKGKLEVTPELIDILLNAIDTVSQMLRATEDALEAADESGDEVELDIEDVEFEALLKELQIVKEGDGSGDDATSDRGASETQSGDAAGEALESSEDIGGGDEAETTMVSHEVPDVEFPPGMKDQFMEEAQEHLENIEKVLLKMEAGQGDQDDMNELFRSLHTLKGNAGVLLSTIEDEEVRKRHPLVRFQELAHSMEETVQKRRDEAALPSEDELDGLLKNVDVLREILEVFSTGSGAIASREQAPSGEEASSDTVEAKGGEALEIPDRLDQLNEAELEALVNTLHQAIEAARKGVDEILVPEKRATALSKVGRAFTMIMKVAEKLGEKEIAEEAEKSYNIVDFMSQNEEPEDHESILLEGVKDGFKLFDELLLKLKERLHKEAPQEKPTSSVKDAAKKAAPSTGASTSSRKDSPSSVKDTRAGGQKAKPTSKKTREAEGKKQPIKVPQERLDKLMNLVGELVVTKNNFSSLVREVNVEYNLPQLAKRIKEFGDGVSRIVDELQATIMTVRMVPVGQIFSRFPRMVRDLSRKLGKKMRLVVSGEETEMDKTIIESLGDPLVHLIRNSADHGIETAEERKALGKPEEGTIWLRAYNKGQSVIIEIEDDGRGIDPNKIKMKALEKGIITHDDIETMSDKEAIMLIFRPGFSTATTVSEVSGRGVGMDVVKTAIEKIGGAVDLDSKLGQGTRVRLQLPLTLAISKGLEVEARGDRYYIPLDYIVETVKAPKEAVHCHRGKALVMIRDSLLQMNDLGEALMGNGNGGGETAFPDSGHIREGYGQCEGQHDEIPLVVLNLGHKKMAVKVDAFYNESEFVLKPLEGPLKSLSGFAGATVTGEGKILLVLDPPKLFMYN